MKPFKLDQLPKINPGFITPDGYFDAFPDEMMQMLRQETKVIPIQRKRSAWIFAAAAVLVLSLSLPVLNQLTTQSNQPDHSEIENYLASQDISQDYLVSMLDSEEINNLKIDYNLEDKTIEEALPDDIENYILD